MAPRGRVVAAQELRERPIRVRVVAEREDGVGVESVQQLGSTFGAHARVGDVAGGSDHWIRAWVRSGLRRGVGVGSGVGVRVGSGAGAAAVLKYGSAANS